MNPILEYFDIETIIQMLGLKMKKMNGYFLGKCPFHEDKNPSFAIKSNTGYFTCYKGCDSGSINKLVYLLTNQSIYKFLDIKDVNSFVFKNSLRKKEKEIDESIFFKKPEIVINGEFLDCNKSEEVKEYLIKRKVDNYFVESFDIKYCRNAYINGTRFINRILIPIYEYGNLLGYEGRDFTSTQKPKVLYNKGCSSAHLFNLDNLSYDDPLIVCEGMWDVAQIYSNITENVTHLFGAKVSSKQKEELKNFKEIILFVDNDEAGLSVINQIDEFYDENEFYIAVPPKEGMDPGDCTLEEIKECLNKKQLCIDYLLNKHSLLFDKRPLSWS
jgi:DNA primase